MAKIKNFLPTLLPPPTDKKFFRNLKTFHVPKRYKFFLFLAAIFVPFFASNLRT
jgi:hypothetical protein